LDGWHDTDRYPDAQEIAGVVIFRWEAPLFFANAGIFREQIRELVRHRRPEWIVLQCEAVTDVDVTAADMLEDLDNELNDQGVHLAFVELRGRIQDLLHRYGMFATLDRSHIFPTIGMAMAAIGSENRDSDLKAGGAAEDDPPELPEASPPAE
jgi:MFS superfamily sulfate permease-like transporter